MDLTATFVSAVMTASGAVIGWTVGWTARGWFEALRRRRARRA